MAKKFIEELNRDNKVFVLHSSVILHDYESIFNFENNDVVIPIMVFEDVDHFKEGKSAISFHARKFIESIEAYGQNIFNGGEEIAPGKGKISVKLGVKLQDTLERGGFSLDRADHQFLNIVAALEKAEASRGTNRPVILITKNGNLRTKARAIGLKAEDYTSDYVDDIERICQKPRVIEGVSKNIISELYRQSSIFAPSEIVLEEPFRANEFFTLRNGSASILATFDANLNMIRKIHTEDCARIKARNAEQFFALDALMNKNIKLVAITGKAGTGKTLLALAAAIEQRADYHEIMLARPVTPLRDENIGFLPGDADAKISPYIAPLDDNLSIIKSGSSKLGTEISKMRERQKIHIEALAFIRGRSLVKSYFIIDEFQNLTPHAAKTIVTRAAEGTKVILTGDIFQIDNPYLNTKSNGLSHVMSRMYGQGVFAHIHLEKCERSELAELTANLL